MLRYLRIAVSATFFIACMLLVVFWVRSYWWKQSWSYYRFPQYSAICSYRGGLSLTVRDIHPALASRTTYWNRNAEYITAKTSPPLSVQLKELGVLQTTIGIGRLRAANLYVIGVPHWFPVLLCASLAAMLWLWSWRFSLRAMLVAVTLVGVLLGLAFAVRR